MLNDEATPKKESSTEIARAYYTEKFSAWRLTHDEVEGILDDFRYTKNNRPTDPEGAARFLLVESNVQDRLYHELIGYATKGLARLAARTQNVKGRLVIGMSTKDSGFLSQLSHAYSHWGDPKINNFSDQIKTLHFSLGAKSRIRQSANSGVIIKYKGN